MLRVSLSRPRAVPGISLLALVLAHGVAFAVQDGAWIQPAINVGPNPRLAHVAAFDPVGNRMIVFGGTETLGDTWSLSLGDTPQWTQLQPGPSPSGRKASSMVYDPTRRRMILFGGYDGNYRNDVWSLALDGTPFWTELQPLGPLPSGRMFTVAVFDPTRDRMVVMGGHPPALNDVWALEFDTGGSPQWVQLQPTGTLPTERYGHVGVFDAARDRLIIWGAADQAVSVLSFATLEWTTHNIPMAPSLRYYASAVLDLTGDRMVVFGGNGSLTSIDPFNDVGALNLTGGFNWQPLFPAGTPPTERFGHTAVYEPEGGRMVVFGGYGATADVHTLVWGPASGGPTISGFSRPGGEVGDPVSILGSALAGATEVRFNGTPATILSVNNYEVATTVPVGATTGPVEVTTPEGVAVSPQAFIVTPRPLITSVTPDSGHIDSEVAIRGSYFAGATYVHLGGLNPVPFVVVSDSLIVATVTANAADGPVRVANIAGTTTSSILFDMLSPDPLPRLVSVRDVRADQGGRVTIKWLRSDYDGLYQNSVRSYRIWRRAPTDAGARATPSATDAAAIDFWEEIGTVSAARLPGYSFTAPTLRDSMAGDNPYTAFFVQALTGDVAVFYSSGVDSGYSVDNLSPPAPAPFIAVYGGSGTALHWGVSSAPDFAQFRLHRGTSAEFVPGDDNLVVAQRDTGYFDPPGSELYWYKLAAVDVHGNVGRYAIVSPAGPTAVLATALEARYEGGRVSLTWYLSEEPLGACVVYRQAGAGGWVQQGTVAADAGGYLRWQDAAVTAGERYAYRLGIPTETGEVTAGEVAVEVPGGSLDQEIRVPNPVREGEVTVSFALPAGRTVKVELLDVMGRVVAARSAAGQGRTTLGLARADRLAPGLYFVRIGLPGAPIRRVAVVR